MGVYRTDNDPRRSAPLQCCLCVWRGDEDTLLGLGVFLSGKGLLREDGKGYGVGSGGIVAEAEVEARLGRAG